MRRSLFLAVLACSVGSPALWAQEPEFLYPVVAGYGGVVKLPNAVDFPRKGAKIVFDITAQSKPEDVNRGLESVARYLNLNALAGHAPADARLALVLHGGATQAALEDSAYERHTSVAQNPNLPLLRELGKQGVEVLVCGQSLARNKFSPRDVAGEVVIAASAMTVNVNRQAAGYAYLPVH